MPAGLDAGTAFVTVLPNTSKFAPALEGEVKGALNKTNAGLSTFQKGAVIAFSAASVAAIKFGASSVQAYLESQQVLAQLQNTIAHTPGYTNAATAAFQKQATALQNLTGYEDEQILSADNALIRFKLTQQQVSDLIPLILDYARATGTDAVAAAENIGKALLGNTRALKTIGIEFHATGDRGKDLATIMDALRSKVGGAAEAFGKTSQGKIEIFRARLNDLQETIGKALVPVLDAIVKGLTFVVGEFSKLPGPVKEATVVVTALGLAFVGLGLALSIVRTALAGYGVAAAKATAETVATTAATDAAAVATTGYGSALAASIPLLGAAGAALAGYAADQYLQAQSAKQAAEGHTLFAKALYAVGRLLDPIANALGITGNEMQDIDLKAQGAGRALDGMRISLSNAKTLAERAAVVFGDAGDSVNRLGHFMGLSSEAFKAWRISTRDAVNGVKGSLDELAGKAHLTAGEIIKAFSRQLVAMSRYKNNWEILLARGLPQDLAQQLQEMGLKGAGIVAALAHANQAQFNKIIGQWKHARDEAAVTTGAIKAIGDEAVRIAKNYTITFTVKTVGNAPPVHVSAHGGAFLPRYAGGSLFAGPMGPFIAGEASYPTPLGTGAEIASSAGVLPLNEAMIARLGHAIAQAGGSTGDPDAIGRSVARHMWQMMRSGGGGEIVLRARGRDLVAVLRGEELWNR